jgi:hypothetical protein
MKKEYKIGIWIFFVLGIFLIGYYLRAYISIYQYLPGSPYEVFTSKNNYSLFSTKTGISDFQDKFARYPTVFIATDILNPILGNFYIVYLIGAIIIFFLGREITESNFGGFLSFIAYALAGENLLQYTRAVSGSGLCYVFIWASLLFLLKYLKNWKDYNIYFFVLFSILSLITYHTGATALIMIIVGMLVSIIYSSYENKGNDFSFKLDRKIFLSFLTIILFYIIWLKLFDFAQLLLIINAFKDINNIILVIIFLIIISTFIILLSIAKLKFLHSEFFPFISVFIAGFLVFSKSDIFGWVLRFGVSNYYISTITLNNYIGQAILLHVYVLVLIPSLFKKELDKKQIFLRGWLIGLSLVFLGLASEHFYARILDYSFPFTFILLGLYWKEHKRFRFFIVTATIVLLIISQLMIYNDPFSMRRYYTQEEVNSAKNITLSLFNNTINGTVISDLRTSALFSYLGNTGVTFGNNNNLLHDKIFYKYQNYSYPGIKYVILSESMREVVYGINFETRPLNDSIFDFYDKKQKKIYDDGLMKVYKIVKRK